MGPMFDVPNGTRVFSRRKISCQQLCARHSDASVFAVHHLRDDCHGCGSRLSEEIERPAVGAGFSRRGPAKAGPYSFGPSLGVPSPLTLCAYNEPWTIWFSLGLLACR